MKMSDVFKGNAAVHEVVGNRKHGSPKFVLSDSGEFAYGVTRKQLNAAVHAINNHDRLTEENAKLRHELTNLIYMAENNTGHDPSLSCFHLAADEAKQLLNQLKDQGK